MSGFGQDQVRTLIQYNNGEHITLAMNAMKQAQSLLQRPTTTEELTKTVSAKTIQETKPVEIKKEKVEVSPVKEEPKIKKEIVKKPYEAETIPSKDELKIIEKEIIDEKPTVESDSSSTDVKPSKKVEADYSISQYNNPGNIEQGIKWEGLAEGGYGPKERFAIFITPEAGIRALKKDLTTKLNRHNGNLLKMIEQYAPESENDVKAYMKVVQQTAGVKDVYTEADLNNIVKGFIRMENKKELADKYITRMES